ncbi:MAG TPA: hypothetical protein VGM94_02645 [Galbitalea sp.]
MPDHLTGVVAIAADGRYNLALTSDGSVEAWGVWGRGSVKSDVTAPRDLGSVTGVAAGSNHALALLEDGTVAAWGENGAGQCDVPSSLTGVVRIAGGGAHSLAVTQSGAVVAWGDSNWSQQKISDRVDNARLGDIFDIAADGSLNLFLLDDGTVVAWDCHADMWGDVIGGPDRGFYAPAEFSGPRVSAIATGYANHLAVRDGYVLRAQSSRLTSPVPVPADLGRAVDAAAGDGHSMALRADGTVGAWGSNEYGQAVVPSEFAR